MQWSVFSGLGSVTKLESMQEFWEEKQHLTIGIMVYRIPECSGEKRESATNVRGAAAGKAAKDIEYLT